MTSEACCVCDKPAVRPLGSRLYCEEHYANALRENRGFWKSGLVNIGLIALFTVVVAGVTAIVPLQLSDTGLVIAGLVIAIVPACLWLAYFYQQDQLEPEPRHYVLAVFGLALLITEVVWRYLIQGVFKIGDWIALDNSTALVGSILVIGFTLEAIKYAVVRFTVYPTAEFDERMDGIVYGTAAGLGVATMLNINFIIQSGGAALSPGVIHVVIVALAQAAFGGIVGYFLGEAKFTHEEPWWMPLGITIAAVTNGLFTYLLAEINQSGITVSPWRGLLFALLVAVATFGALLTLIRRAIAHTLQSDSAKIVRGA